MRPVRGMYYDTSLVYVRIVFVLLVLAVAICNILCVAVLFFGLSLAVYGFKARRNSFPFLFSYNGILCTPRAPWGVVDWVVGRGVAAWAARLFSEYVIVNSRSSSRIAPSTDLPSLRGAESSLCIGLSGQRSSRVQAIGIARRKQ